MYACASASACACARGRVCGLLWVRAGVRARTCVRMCEGAHVYVRMRVRLSGRAAGASA